MDYKGMKIIQNIFIPLDGYKAMTIYKFIFTRYSKQINQRDINHEYIHYKQYNELLILFFLPWYLIEFLIKLLLTFNWKKAYKSISLEQEAFEHQYEDDYSEKRKHYNWLKNVFKIKH